MSKTYTQFDWACDRSAREQWADEEERLLNEIDGRMRRRDKRQKRMNHKNGRAWA